jgi:hypothetical protein
MTLQYILLASLLYIPSALYFFSVLSLTTLVATICTSVVAWVYYNRKELKRSFFNNAKIKTDARGVAEEDLKLESYEHIGKTGNDEFSHPIYRLKRTNETTIITQPKDVVIDEKNKTTAPQLSSTKLITSMIAGTLHNLYSRDHNNYENVQYYLVSDTEKQKYIASRLRYNFTDIKTLAFGYHEKIVKDYVIAISRNPVSRNQELEKQYNIASNNGQYTYSKIPVNYKNNLYGTEASKLVSPEILKNVKGLEKVIAACLLNGDPSLFSITDIGVTGEDNKAIKIDHSQALDFTYTEPNAISTLSKLLDRYSIYYSHELIFSNKFAHALEEVASTSGQHIRSHLYATVQDICNKFSKNELALFAINVLHKDIPTIDMEKFKLDLVKELYQQIMQQKQHILLLAYVIRVQVALMNNKIDAAYNLLINHPPYIDFDQKFLLPLNPEQQKNMYEHYLSLLDKELIKRETSLIMYNHTINNLNNNDLLIFSAADRLSLRTMSIREFAEKSILKLCSPTQKTKLAAILDQNPRQEEKQYSLKRNSNLDELLSDLLDTIQFTEQDILNKVREEFTYAFKHDPSQYLIFIRMYKDYRKEKQATSPENHDAILQKYLALFANKIIYLDTINKETIILNNPRATGCEPEPQEYKTLPW